MTEKSIKGILIARVDVTHPNHSGVDKKLKAQQAALERALGPVDLWTLGEASILLNGKEVIRARSGKISRIWLYASRFYLEVAKHLGDADYIYIRYQRSTPAFISFLHKAHQLRPSMPIFVELPTYPYEGQHIGARDKVLGLIDRMLRGHMKRYIHRIITFADESTIFGVPTIRTENGIDVSQIRNFKKLLGYDKDSKVVLVSVANVSFYHGYDRLILGLADFKRSHPNRHVILHLVGAGSALPELKALTKEQGVEDIIYFHGPLLGQSLDAVMQLSDLGISHLGLHRKKADTSDLKSREFCARGLPFLIAYADRDFTGDFPFCMHAPPDESPINIASLLEFYDRLRIEHPDYAERLRQYAEERLTWDSKLAAVVTEIRNVVSDNA